MNAEMLRDIIFVSLLLIFIMLISMAALQIKIFKYKHKIYFIRRDRERCNEVLYAAKAAISALSIRIKRLKIRKKKLWKNVRAGWLLCSI